MTRPKLHLDWIDPHAVKIVETLKRYGFEAYLVGGCVRDLLIGIHPKDYDIATNAPPEQIRRHIGNSYIIGRRFRLVLVKRGQQQYEVATFRRNGPTEELIESNGGESPEANDSRIRNALPQDRESSPISGDNFFGTIEEDAKRRDFTINALFYDPVGRKIIDYCDGQKDIENHILRMIGNPKERFIEDPIRIFRAVRLAHKLHFQLDPHLRSAIKETSSELIKSVLPRRREEYLKILRLKHPEQAFIELHDLGVFKDIAPILNDFLNNEEQRDLFFQMLARIHMTGVDLHSPYELIAAFLYCFVKTLHETTHRDCKEILEDSKTLDLSKNELGFFKLEYSQLHRCLEVIESLKNIETFKRKGLRRQAAFLSNDILPLALNLGQLDYSIRIKDLNFWNNELKNQIYSPSR